ncbi:MAG: adenylyl-sulfate reductase subunit alpha [Deltaproteobacteria bacterium]|jgi:adenylylsulfate reductase subunit A|nr:adenylyl-sulfate reductase subunit alpha [Deltaproteobacteria bacterium]
MLTHKNLEFEALIIGGGAAGCLAAIKLSQKGIKVALLEKAFLKRSGCLAAGVNALNAYIGQRKTPLDYARYALNDAHGLARFDLLLSMAEKLNKQVSFLESIGLTVHKDQTGRYAERGWRNLRVNGENIKPLLAEAVFRAQNVTVLERTNATHLLALPGRVLGAAALSRNEEAILFIKSRAILIATGGAAGLYRPPNPGLTNHRLWYSPFNTGGGLAMGIKAGAEMTTLEMRFVALRCRDTFAPTGTLALGAMAEQTNSFGREYEADYGRTTSQRVLGARREIEAGRGPCYLQAEFDREAKEQLYKAYLNMSPLQTLKFLEAERNTPFSYPLSLRVEIASSEPYVQGGHTAGGFWVDTNRRTTLKGLWAAGDAAGGAPQKYVTGAMAEAEIAADDMAGHLNRDKNPKIKIQHNFSVTQAQDNETYALLCRKIQEELEHHFKTPPGVITDRNLTEALQKTMDLYAGGLGTGYRYSLAELREAKKTLKTLEELSRDLPASDIRDLLNLWEVREKLVVAQSLVEHLSARRETRWPGFGEFTDFPEKDDSFLVYINSALKEQGGLKIIRRPIVRVERYEHE